MIHLGIKARNGMLMIAGGGQLLVFHLQSLSTTTINMCSGIEMADEIVEDLLKHYTNGIEAIHGIMKEKVIILPQ
ncbi:hypothetical protein HK096_001091, partial [Nowakowskiella sp. JEL0078]